MSVKRFMVSVAAVFLFALVWNGVVHTVILKEANLALLEVARPAGERNMALAIALTLGIAVVFVWSFYRWARDGGLKEGLLHGALFAVVAGLFVDLNQYLVYPLPASLAAKWFAFCVPEFLCYGVIVSVLYKRKEVA